MPERRDSREILALTTQIVTAHVSHNTVSADELPKLLQQIFETLSCIDRGGQTAIAPKGAISVSKYSLDSASSQLSLLRTTKYSR